MKYYAVAEIDVTDRSWVRAYVDNVTGLVEQAGGRYLARTSRIEKIEGERKTPQIFLIIEWPSKDIADTFYASAEYGPYRQRRIDGARNEFVLVAGEDVNKVARIADYRGRRDALASRRSRPGPTMTLLSREVV